MIASKGFPFAGKDLVAGDKFEADDEVQANLLQTIGHAAREATDSKRGRYQRRDLRAED